MRIMVVMQTDGQLLEVIFAGGTSGCFPGLLHGGQQQGYQNRNNRNYDQQLNQSKSGTSPGRDA